MTTFNKPGNWGSDELSHFIDLTHNNEFATFEHKRKAYSLLESIDAIYQGLAENLVNTAEIIPGLLYLRAHSAYRGACRMAMSGQVTESFVIARSCLEYALYALHIAKNPEARDIWLHRHDSDEYHKRCRNEFRHANVLQTLNADNPAVCKVAHELYEKTIDFGGHPNERAVTSALRVSETEKGINLTQLYIVGDSAALDGSLRIVAEIGLCALSILRIIWKERFDILGISAQLKNLRQNLN